MLHKQQQGLSDQSSEPAKFTFLVLMFYWFAMLSSQDHLVSDIVPNPQKCALNQQRQNLNKEAVFGIFLIE